MRDAPARPAPPLGTQRETVTDDEVTYLQSPGAGLCLDARAQRGRAMALTVTYLSHGGAAPRHCSALAR